MNVSSMSDLEKPPQDHENGGQSPFKHRIFLPTSLGWGLGALTWIVLLLLIYWIAG